MTAIDIIIGLTIGWFLGDVIRPYIPPGRTRFIIIVVLILLLIVLLTIRQG